LNGWLGSPSCLHIRLEEQIQKIAFIESSALVKGRPFHRRHLFGCEEAVKGWTFDKQSFPFGGSDEEEDDVEKEDDEEEDNDCSICWHFNVMKCSSSSPSETVAEKK